jgi:hypothetical protein
MNALWYLAWAVALFFAGSWAFGLVIRPDYRLKSTVATVLFWWIEIATLFVSGVSVFHLLWLMPISLLLPMFIMLGDLRAAFVFILVRSGLIIVPALGALIYFS